MVWSEEAVGGLPVYCPSGIKKRWMANLRKYRYPSEKLKFRRWQPIYYNWTS